MLVARFSLAADDFTNSRQPSFLIINISRTVHNDWNNLSRTVNNVTISIVANMVSFDIQTIKTMFSVLLVDVAAQMLFRTIILVTLFTFHMVESAVRMF